MKPYQSWDRAPNWTGRPWYHPITNWYWTVGHIFEQGRGGRAFENMLGFRVLVGRAVFRIWSGRPCWALFDPIRGFCFLRLHAYCYLPTLTRSRFAAPHFESLFTVGSSASSHSFIIFKGYYYLWKYELKWVAIVIRANFVPHWLLSSSKLGKARMTSNKLSRLFFRIVNSKLHFDVVNKHVRPEHFRRQTWSRRSSDNQFTPGPGGDRRATGGLGSNRV